MEINEILNSIVSEINELWGYELLAEQNKCSVEVKLENERWGQYVERDEVIMVIEKWIK